MRFMNIDSPFYRIMSSVGDMLILGLLWFFLSIFIIPLGAATTALFYVFTKKHSGKSIYIWQEFWQSFRQNFIKATIINVIFIVLLLLLAFNLWHMGFFGGTFPTIIIVFQLFILAQVLFIMIFIYPVLSRFNLKFKEYFKTAFFLANRHFLTTIICLLSLAGVMLISYMFLPFMLIMMGFYANIASRFIVKIFKKHRPDFDPPEAKIELEPLDLTLDLNTIEQAKKDLEKDEKNS